MKATTTLFWLLVLVQDVVAHYMWSRLLVNGTQSEEFEYIRDVGESPLYAGGPDELGKIAPQNDIASPDITCGREAWKFASGPKTADILAGSEVGFRLSDHFASAQPPSFVFHPGPGQIYLARPPEGVELAEFAGMEGEWFKIAVAGPEDDRNWKLLNKREFNFTIPATTPPGKYLLRIEQFMPMWALNWTQWYINCAHVNIIGPGGGSPIGMARFPGTYTDSDPGIIIPEEMAQYPPDALGLSAYVPPGPAVWGED